MSWAIHWSNPKNTYFGPICFWLFIGAILRIHILVQYVLGLICFGSNMFWYEYVLGTICFGMNMFWSNMFPNMFWAQYVFVQYVLTRHGYTITDLLILEKESRQMISAKTRILVDNSERLFLLERFAYLKWPKFLGQKWSFPCKIPSFLVGHTPQV